MCYPLTIMASSDNGLIYFLPPHSNVVSPETNMQYSDSDLINTYNAQMPDLNLIHDTNDLSSRNTPSHYVFPQDLTRSKCFESNNFSVLHYNIRSLSKNF